LLVVEKLKLEFLLCLWIAYIHLWKTMNESFVRG